VDNLILAVLIAIASGILGGVIGGLLQGWYPWLLPPDRRGEDE